MNSLTPNQVSRLARTITDWDVEDNYFQRSFSDLILINTIDVEAMDDERAEDYLTLIVGMTLEEWKAHN